ncbi:uncharacterized protein LOC100186759 [Ciona intestinalis]
MSEDEQKSHKRKLSENDDRSNLLSGSEKKKKKRENSSNSSRPKYYPLSERQQLALLMQMTAEEKPALDVDSTPTSSSRRTPGSSGRKDKVNKRNERGETPLHLATIRGDMHAIVDLIKQGADINVQDYAGWTPLHEACNHGYSEIAKFLLESGANVNSKGLDDDYPLHDAVINAHSDLVHLLLKHGANPLLPNKHGERPLDLGDDESIRKMMQAEVILSDESDQEESPLDPLISEIQETGAKSHTIRSSTGVVSSVHSPSKPHASTASRGVVQTDSCSNRLQGYSKINRKNDCDISSCTSSNIVDDDKMASLVHTPLKHDVYDFSPTSEDSLNNAGGIRLKPSLQYGTERWSDLKSKGKDCLYETSEMMFDRLFKSPTNYIDSKLSESKPASYSLQDNHNVNSFNSAEVCQEEEKTKPSSKLTNFGSPTVITTSTPTKFVPKLLNKSKTVPKLLKSGKTSDDTKKITTIKPQNQKRDVKLDVKKTLSLSKSNSMCYTDSASRQQNQKQLKLKQKKVQKKEKNLKHEEKKVLRRAEVKLLDTDSWLGSPVDKVKPKKLPRPFVKKIIDSQSDVPATTTSETLSDFVTTPDQQTELAGPPVLKANETPATFSYPIQSTTNDKSNPALHMQKQVNQPSVTTVTARSPPCTHHPYTVLSCSKENTITSNSNVLPLEVDCKLPVISATNISKPSTAITYIDMPTVEFPISSCNLTSTVNTKMNEPFSPTSGNTTVVSTITTVTSTLEVEEKESNNTPHDVDLHHQQTDNDQQNKKLNSPIKEKAELTKQQKLIQEYIKQRLELDTIDFECEKRKQLPIYIPLEKLVESAKQSNVYEERLSIQKWMMEKRKRFTSIIPQAPQYYWEYMTFTGGYLLVGNVESRLSVPVLAPPPFICGPMTDLFKSHEEQRVKLRVQHAIEREKMIISCEQEMMRVHSRAARTVHNQQAPFSACSLLMDNEVYNIPRQTNDESGKPSIRDRFNARMFLAWLQDVDDKFEKMKKGLLSRQKHEAEAMFAVQKTEWLLKLQELDVSHRTFQQSEVNELHVPMVNISDDFDLLPA